MRNLQRDDRGAYTCVAENGINPPDSWKVQIRVFCPPICTPVQSVVGQAQNRRFNAKLTCIVKGTQISSFVKQHAELYRQNENIMKSRKPSRKCVGLNNCVIGLYNDQMFECLTGANVFSFLP